MSEIGYREIGYNFHLSCVSHLKEKIVDLFEKSKNNIDIINIPRRYVSGRLANYDTIVVIPPIYVSIVYTEFTTLVLRHNPENLVEAVAITKKTVPTVTLDDLKKMRVRTYIRGNQRYSRAVAVVDLSTAVSLYSTLFQTHGADLKHLVSLIAYEKYTTLFIVNGEKVYFPVFYSTMSKIPKRYLVPRTPEYENHWFSIARLE